MAPIKSVAVIGASGNLGQPVVKELLAAGFDVTALARESSTASFPEGVIVKKVDFSSPGSIKSAFSGQDAVVSTIATLAVGTQTALVDAAVEAGVKRYIPSEFGVNTRTLDIPGLKTILGGKIKVVDYLQEKANENPAFTWTGLTVGAFFDWGLSRGFLGLDAKAKTSTLVDSGDEPFPASTLRFIGKAVAAVLTHPDETANRYLAVAGSNPSRNQVLQAVEELTGEKWTVKKLVSSDLSGIADDKLAQHDFGGAFSHYLAVYLFADGAGRSKSNDNALLGLQEEDYRAVLNDWLVSESVIKG